MNIFEVIDPDGLSAYNPEDDKLNRIEKDDTRKHKLTLMDVNKLKKLRALRKLDAMKREDLLAIMYGDDGGDDGGFGGNF